MKDVQGARNVIAALDGTRIWSEMDSPLVVKWMDTELQRKRREEHLAALRQVRRTQAITVVSNLNLN